MPLLRNYLKLKTTSSQRPELPLFLEKQSDAGDCKNVVSILAMFHQHTCSWKRGKAKVFVQLQLPHIYHENVRPQCACRKDTKTILFNPVIKISQVQGSNSFQP
jgi:hypothetical protein